MSRSEQIVFAISPQGQGDGVPVLLLGIPAAAFEYIRDGKTNTFDLTRVGVPLKLVIFGGETHASIAKTLDQVLTVDRGQAYVDMRGTDFSMQPKKEG